MGTPQEVRDYHKYDDVDSGRLAHHHTLGRKVNQAAPGNALKVVEDLLNWTNRPYLEHHADGSQIVASGGGQVTVEWDTVYKAAQGGLFIDGAGIITIGEEGDYTFDGNVSFTNDATGTGRRLVAIRKNGVDIEFNSNNQATATGEHAVGFARTFFCEEGDTVEIRCSQNSGGNLNVTNSSRLTVRKNL